MAGAFTRGLKEHILQLVGLCSNPGFTFPNFGYSYSHFELKLLSCQLGWTPRTVTQACKESTPSMESSVGKDSTQSSFSAAPSVFEEIHDTGKLLRP